MTTVDPKPKSFSPEVRERGVRLVREHQGEYASPCAAIRGIAEKLGCPAETLRSWVRRTVRDAGHRPGVARDGRERLEALERENRGLERADEILRKASA
jgi:transposase